MTPDKFLTAQCLSFPTYQRDDNQQSHLPESVILRMKGKEAVHLTCLGRFLATVCAQSGFMRGTASNIANPLLCVEVGGGQSWALVRPWWPLPGCRSAGRCCYSRPLRPSLREISSSAPRMHSARSQQIVSPAHCPQRGWAILNFLVRA